MKDIPLYITSVISSESYPQPAVLFNNGPTSLGFVIILEEGGVAQEIKEGEDKSLPRALSSCITASPNQVTYIMRLSTCSIQIML